MPEDLYMPNVEEHKLKLTKALLFFKKGRPDYNCYPYSNFLITEHPVRNGKIAEGAVLSEASFKHFREFFVAERLLQYIPERVIAYSGEFLMWWTPAQKRPLFFEKLIGIPNGMAPVPPLVFLVTANGGMFVYAMTENARPTPKTVLYHAPFYNLYEETGVCLGDANRAGVSLSDVEKWEDVFFGSEFTHADNPPRLKGTTGKKLWNDLIKRKRKVFPVEYLVKQTTLGKLFGKEGVE